MKNLLLLISSLGILLVSSAVAYYFAFALPKLQTEKQLLESQKFQLERDKQEAEKLNAQHYQTCKDEANEKATQLLKDKIEIANKAGTAIPSTWKEASAKGLMLKEDYESYYNNCLKSYGLN